METKKRVALIGAGFSGLTAAWALQKKGFHVEVFEKSSCVGGLIRQHGTDEVIESAAHAVLNSADIEELFSDLDIQLLRSLPSARQRWIFRHRPRRWPLTAFETVKALGWPRQPLAEESVASWVTRSFSKEMNDFFIAAALQGIYGAPSSDLSAKLILKSMFNKKNKDAKGTFRGSVAPEKGMFHLIEKLSKKITVHLQRDVPIQDLLNQFDAVVIATNVKEAGRMIAPLLSEISAKIESLPMASLTSVTLHWSPGSDGPQVKKPDLHGFGCLFPKSEKFNSLGVLFNSDIFAGRGQNSETWIFADSFQQTADDEVLAKILADRKRIRSDSDFIRASSIHRWPQVLPVYGLELEKFLDLSLWQEDPFLNGARLCERVYLTGNYLGGIGLSKILSYNKRLSARIAKEVK